MLLSGRACTTLSQALTVLLVLTLLGGCSGKSPGADVALLPGETGTEGAFDAAPLEVEEAAAMMPALPALSMLPKASSGSLNDSFIYTTGERLIGVPFENRFSLDGDIGVFSPAFSAGVSPFEGLAYCIFPVGGLADYSGPELLYLGWQGEAPPQSNVYIALSDHANGRWRLRPGPAPGEQLDLGQVSHMLDPEGVLHVAVILGGLAECRLEYMLFGEMLLGGQTVATPDLGTGSLQTEITVEHEIAGGVVESFDLDVDGDGSFDLLGDSDGVWQVEYPQPGKFHPTARMNPSNGGSLLALPALVRVLNPDNQPPEALLTPEIANGSAPLLISFDASASTDSDGVIELYEWDFDGDGSYDFATTVAFTSFNYGSAGSFSAGLRVTDSDLATSEAFCDISVSEGWQSRLLDADSDNEDIRAASSGPLFQARPFVVYSVHLPGVHELRCVRGLDTAGEGWDSIEVLNDATDTAYLPQVLSYDFRPAVAYSEGSSLQERRLLFQRASSGGGWDAPIVVSETLGGRLSTGIADGLPCIAVSAGDNSLNFFRAEDSGLASWSKLELMPADGLIGSPPRQSLALFNNAGIPNLLMAQTSDDTVQRLSAVDSAGSLWQGSALCFPADLIYFSQRMVEGRPALSYLDRGSMRSLYYNRSLDAAGTQWEAPVLIDDSADKSHAYALASINGLPAVAWLDMERDYVAVSFASDVDGAGWEEPLYIAASGGGQGVSLELQSSQTGRPLLYHQRRKSGGGYELYVSAPPVQP